MSYKQCEVCLTYIHKDIEPCDKGHYLCENCSVENGCAFCEAEKVYINE